MPVPRPISNAWKKAGILAYPPLYFLTKVVDALSRSPRFADREPELENPMSQLATQRQCESPVFDLWRDRMGLGIRDDTRYDRKVWEWVYILQVLETSGLLRAGSRGLGFGVGREPLAALMAARGCSIVATDLPPGAETSTWSETDQHASQLADLNEGGLCPSDEFAKRVQFRPMDMRHLDRSLGTFDFVWSSCALEHLGTLGRGWNFIREALDLLRPGGVAVHTTEYNVGSNLLTLPVGSVVLYRRRDVLALREDMRRAGHRMEVNLHPGDGPLDGVIDRPPFRARHLKLLAGPFVSTSLGIWICKQG